MKKENHLLNEVIHYFVLIHREGKQRNWFMPGDPRYQPALLQPFLGYDMWAG